MKKIWKVRSIKKDKKKKKRKKMGFVSDLWMFRGGKDKGRRGFWVNKWIEEKDRRNKDDFGRKGRIWKRE